VRGLQPPPQLDWERERRRRTSSWVWALGIGRPLPAAFWALFVSLDAAEVLYSLVLRLSWAYRAPRPPLTRSLARMERGDPEQQLRTEEAIHLTNFILVGGRALEEVDPGDRKSASVCAHQHELTAEGFSLTASCTLPRRLRGCLPRCTPWMRSDLYARGKLMSPQRDCMHAGPCG
jgi:hypothetical protein